MRSVKCREIFTMAGSLSSLANFVKLADPDWIIEQRERDPDGSSHRLNPYKIKSDNQANVAVQKGIEIVCALQCERERVIATPCLRVLSGVKHVNMRTFPFLRTPWRSQASQGL